MSIEYLEISFCVPSNVIDDQINSRIIDEIITISPNIIKLTHSQGTNAIDVSAVWEEFEIDRRIGDIRPIANVSDVLGVRKKFVVNIKESLKISESVSWDIKRDPVENINRAKDAKDYYTAISLACTVFQYFGKQILFRSTAAVTKNINLHSIIDELYNKNVIDKIVSDNMQKARTLRNPFQHEDRAMNYSSNQAEEAEQTIAQALDCVKILIKKFDDMVNQGQIT